MLCLTGMISGYWAGFVSGAIFTHNIKKSSKQMENTQSCIIITENESERAGGDMNLP